MTSHEDKKTVAVKSETADACKPGDADWTSGLKRLYDSVLDEPLPDAFKDLLSKLDEDGAK